MSYRTDGSVRPDRGPHTGQMQRRRRATHGQQQIVKTFVTSASLPSLTRVSDAGESLKVSASDDDYSLRSGRLQRSQNSLGSMSWTLTPDKR